MLLFRFAIVVFVVSMIPTIGDCQAKSKKIVSIGPVTKVDFSGVSKMFGSTKFGQPLIGLPVTPTTPKAKTAAPSLSIPTPNLVFINQTQANPLGARKLIFVPDEEDKK